MEGREAENDECLFAKFCDLLRQYIIWNFHVTLRLKTIGHHSRIYLCIKLSGNAGTCGGGGLRRWAIVDGFIIVQREVLINDYFLAIYHG